jgi:hypothetical protein
MDGKQSEIIESTALGDNCPSQFVSMTEGDFYLDINQRIYFPRRNLVRVK